MQGNERESEERASLNALVERTVGAAYEVANVLGAGFLEKVYEHVKGLSQRLRNSSVKPFQEQGLPIIFERNPEIDKDELAREVASKRSIDAGLVCAVTTAEMCPTFEHRGTHIVRRERPCGVVYQYQIHPEVGWMYARIQTWFPFNLGYAHSGHPERRWRSVDVLQS
jgi:hypothetical protein